MTSICHKKKIVIAYTKFSTMFFAMYTNKQSIKNFVYKTLKELVIVQTKTINLSNLYRVSSNLVEKNIKENMSVHNT